VINKGVIVEDGPLDVLIGKLAPYRMIEIELEMERELDLQDAELVSRDGTRVCLRFDREKTTAAAVIAAISRQCEIRDLRVREPAIEDAIKKIYGGDAPRTSSGT
jgi:ABC-2 type transport system ATP-binding protein